MKSYGSYQANWHNDNTYHMYTVGDQFKPWPEVLHGPPLALKMN